MPALSWIFNVMSCKCMHIRSFSVGGCMQEKINVLVATPSEFVTAETNETFLHFLFGGLNSQNVCTSCCFNTEFKWLKVMKHGRGFDYSDHTQQGRHQLLTLKHGGLVNGTTLQVTEVGRWTGAALVVPVTTLMLSLSKVLHPPHIITTLPTGSWRNQGLLVGRRLSSANANHRPQRLVSYKANPSANCRESSRGSVVSLRWASTSFMTADVRPLSISRVMEGFCFFVFEAWGDFTQLQWRSSAETFRQDVSPSW